jgi:hypothetical protein
MAKSGSTAWLVERCSRLRDGLLAGDTVTEVEITEVWPGGTENPGRDHEAWIRCSEQLHGLARRIELKMAHGKENDAERKAAVLAALADTPETVTLASLGADGQPRRVTVFAKSYVALGEVSDRNLALAELADARALIQQHGREGGDVELVRRIDRESGYLQRVIVWIATHEGPGLPFPEQAAEPEPPADLSDLHPADLYALSAAFQRVNVKRLTLLDATRSTDRRPDWSVFFATLAGDRSSAHVMRDRSLSSVISQASERARGHEQAMKAAEAKRKQKQKAA